MNKKTKKTLRYTLVILGIIILLISAFYIFGVKQEIFAGGITNVAVLTSENSQSAKFDITATSDSPSTNFGFSHEVNSISVDFGNTIASNYVWNDGVGANGNLNNLQRGKQFYFHSADITDVIGWDSNDVKQPTVKFYNISGYCIALDYSNIDVGTCLTNCNARGQKFNCVLENANLKLYDSNGNDVSANARYVGGSTITAHVEILKQNVQCTSTQTQDCKENELCENNLCYLPPVQPQPILYPMNNTITQNTSGMTNQQVNQINPTQTQEVKYTFFGGIIHSIIEFFKNLFK